MDETILYEDTSAYGTYRVVDRTYDERPARLLFSGDHTPQSGLALDDEPDLLFDYIQRMFEVALSIRPESVLVIGGGAFTLPMVIHERLVPSHIDVVEIDPILPDIAKRFFGLQVSPTLEIHIGDGRDYIDTTPRKYQMICIDAFSEYDIPTSLLTVEAVRRYGQIIQPEGVVVVNFIARYWGHRTTRTHQLLASFSDVFDHAEIYLADMQDAKHDEQNLLLVAYNGIERSFDYLQSRSVETQIGCSVELQLHDN